MASLETGFKIQLGSVLSAIAKFKVVGEQLNHSVVLAQILVNYASYCLSQYNAGNTAYAEKMQVINDKLQQLMYQCPEICIYKDIITTKSN